MSPSELVVASRNAGKLAELAHLLEGLGISVIGAVAAGLGEVDEDGDTLAANAAKKALAAAAATGRLALGDDTGLEVDALGGAPGVRSARYAGAKATYADNNRKLLAALAGVAAERRAARFRTVMALARPLGRPGADGGAAAEVVALCEGVLEGSIAEAPRGAGGFGYDPLFVVAGADQTLAELELADKNLVSHRGRALRAIRERLAAELAGARAPAPFCDPASISAAPALVSRS